MRVEQVMKSSVDGFLEWAGQPSPAASWVWTAGHSGKMEAAPGQQPAAPAAPADVLAVESRLASPGSGQRAAQKVPVVVQMALQAVRLAPEEATVDAPLLVVPTSVASVVAQAMRARLAPLASPVATLALVP